MLSVLSFSHQINRFQTALNLTRIPGYGFNEHGEIKQGGSHPKGKVLDLMLQTLRQAPVYYLDPTKTITFMNTVDAYAAHEEKKIKKTASKIKQLLQRHLSTIKGCFLHQEGKEVNDILDKNPTALTVRDYHLMLHLANLLAFKRTMGHLFYKKAAIIEKINDLRNQHPQLIIQASKESWTPIILHTFPCDPYDLQFFIIVQMYIKCYRDHLLDHNPSFLQRLIQQKAASTDDGFISYVNAYLALHGIAALCQQWDAMEDLQQMTRELDQTLAFSKMDIPDFDRYTSNYIHEPEEYTALFQEGADSFISPLMGEKKPYGQIAKELFDYVQITDEEYDKFYASLYGKLMDYRSLHPEARVPLLPPALFNEKKSFTGIRDIKVPLLGQINQWEREVQHSLQAKNAKAKKPVRLLPAKLPSSPMESSSSASCSTPIEEHTVPPPIPVPCSSPISSSSSEPPLTLAGIEAASILSSAPLNLKQALINTSPFGIEERILAWFDPDQTPSGLNDKSRFVHNFAWVANRIVWDFGFRYPRENKRGTIQPALTMLCQGEQTLYPQPRIFRVTFTFDPKAAIEPPFSYDRTLSCYHRALSQRKQEEEAVEQYFDIGKRQISQLAPHPSVTLETDFPQELIGKVYPDGSYIESVRDAVIIVRDPKNDAPDKPCKLYFFVVR